MRGSCTLITKTLFDLRLDIRIAKIATKGDQIADVFYLRDFEGQKIEDKEHLREIEEGLRYQLIKEWFTLTQIEFDRFLPEKSVPTC